MSTIRIVLFPFASDELEFGLDLDPFSIQKRIGILAAC